jgi:hypothetical protein
MRHYLASLDPQLKKLRALAAMGGSGGDIPPLSRSFFIDNGSQGGTGDGSIASPFKTIHDFIAKATPRVSAPDALVAVVGFLAQSIGGYSNEAVSFPPYASTELSGLSTPFASLTSDIGLQIESFTWNNVAGTQTPTVAIAVLNEVSVKNGITYTDDAGAPTSAIVLTSNGGVEITGPITATGALHLQSVALLGNVAAADGIDIPNSELVMLPGAEAAGNIVALGIEAEGAAFDTSSITVAVSSSFGGCSFEGAPVLTNSNATQAVNFDGSSMHAFLGGGGTVAGTSLVIVEGGYDACPYAGGNSVLPAAADSSVSVDGLAAGTQAGGGNQYFVAPTAAHSCQVKNSNEFPSDTICIFKTNSAGDAAFSIKNNAGTVIAILPAGSTGFAVVQKEGGDWILIRSGAGVTV